MALRKQLPGNQLQRRIALQPQRQIDEVNAQIQQAPSSRQLPIETPAFVGTIRIVKSEIDGSDTTQLPASHALTQLGHSLNVAITKIHAEQSIGAPRSLDNAFGIRCVGGERLLAEHRQPCG